MNTPPDSNHAVEVTCPGCFQPSTRAVGKACPICNYRENAESRSGEFLPVGTPLRSYVVGKNLGQGGFGITYRGYDSMLDMKVAIKEYYPTGMVMRSPDHRNVVLSARNQDENFSYCRHAFLREAQTLAKIRHHHIVRVLSFFEMNGTAYLVMDFYEGEDLARHLGLNQRGGQPGRKLPWLEAVTLLLPVLDGMEEVHQAGFIHRDIKPGNLLVTEKNSLILLDFGSARQVSSSHSNSLQIFTDGYAPYEQCSMDQFNRQGPWTDVYGFAATLYAMLTGNRLPSVMHRIQAQMQKQPDLLKPVRTFAPYAPEALDAIIARALVVEPEQRTRTVAALKRELQELVAKEQTIVTPARKPAVAPGPLNGLLTEPPPKPEELLPELAKDQKLPLPKPPPQRVMALLSENKLLPEPPPKSEEPQPELAKEKKPFFLQSPPQSRMALVSKNKLLPEPPPKSEEPQPGLAKEKKPFFLQPPPQPAMVLVPMNKPLLESLPKSKEPQPELAKEQKPMFLKPPPQPTIDLLPLSGSPPTPPCTQESPRQTASEKSRNLLAKAPHEQPVVKRQWTGFSRGALGIAVIIGGIALIMTVFEGNFWAPPPETANRPAHPAVEREAQAQANAASAADQPAQPAAARKTQPRASVQQRFIDNGDGTITDNRTGLIWLKNANCFRLQNWVVAMSLAKFLENGQCGLGDGSVAGQWRLPSKEEWQTLIDRSAGDPALPSGHSFTGVQSGNYWSSTTYASPASNAWLVNLQVGYVYAGGKAYPRYVWPVRGGR